MKIKDIDVSKNELYKEMRYNEKTKGMPVHVSMKETSDDKKKMGAVSILGLMTTMGYYDSAKKSQDDSLLDIVNAMLENSKNVVSSGERRL